MGTTIAVPVGFRYLLDELRGYGPFQFAESKQDLMFRAGRPSVVLAPEHDALGKLSYHLVYVNPSNDPTGKQAMPADKTPRDYDRWRYRTTPPMDVAFVGNRVVEIDCANAPDCPSAFGVDVGASEQSLLSKLGKPTAVRAWLPGRDIAYADLGVDYLLRQDRVIAIRRVAQHKTGLALLPRYFHQIVHFLHPLQ